MDLTEHLVESAELFKGSFLLARRDQVRLPDGQLAGREYIVHPGAVVIVPLLEQADGVLQVVLERQYRHPVQRTLVELPAGKIDPGEAPLACARRELREETGYEARQWARAGVLHPTVAYSTEAIEIWFARGLRPGPQRLDEGEFIEVFSAGPAELLTWCQNGDITDAKTLIGAFWLQNVLSGAWPLQWSGAPA